MFEKLEKRLNKLIRDMEDVKKDLNQTFKDEHDWHEKHIWWG